MATSFVKQCKAVNMTFAASRARREMADLFCVAVRMLKGQGSALGYVFIPGGICALWLLVACLTTSRPSISLEERMNEKHFKVNRGEKVKPMRRALFRRSAMPEINLRVKLAYTGNGARLCSFSFTGIL
jgi:hypothetical protein